MQAGVVLPTSLANVPGAHPRQVCWPTAGWCEPGVHGRQEADPLEGWYCPGGHPVQVGVSRPEPLANVPAAQTRHSVWPELGWCLPGRQARHEAELFSGWWKPVGHAVHLSAFRVSEN